MEVKTQKPDPPASASGHDEIDESPPSNSEFSVYWENEQDPGNPLNWSSKRKWGIISILSLMCFLTPLASSMLAPGVPLILEEFSVNNNQLATFVVSVFVLGYATGPLLLAPMSELYGRTVVYHVCNALFVAFTIACAAARGMGMLIAFRFLAGFAGVAVLTCGSGSIVDLMPREERGRAMALWSLGPLVGPVMGPVCAGFFVGEIGWRWVFWIIAIAYGITTLASFAVLRETYPPTLLRRKAARLREETGKANYRSRLEGAGSPREAFMSAIVRPVKMLVFLPPVTIMCCYIAIVYGLLYLLFTTFTFVYEDTYGFSSRGAGLSFIAGGIGNVAGLLITGFASDHIIRNKQRKGIAPRAEDRLNRIITVPAATLLPLGLIMYGWTADKGVHWIAPMIGTSIMGFGMMGVFMSVQVYLVDAYPEHAASVTAANAVLRSILGGVLPLFGLELYDALGLGWGNTLLGLILVALAPVLWLFATFGERIRNSSRFKRTF